VPDTALDAVIAPSLDPWDLLGLELHWLESVSTARIAPVLLIYALAGRLVSIGRYHLYGGAPERGGIAAMRRLTGGRVVGAGEGWLGVALVLPQRSALLPVRDASIRAEQVMNRYVRGLIAGLRSLGCDCFYPGRDAITLQQREIAMCSFETDASGALLFESLVAVNRGMEEVVQDLERLDPLGALNCPMYGPDRATKLVRELDRDLPFADAAAAVARGYESALGSIRVRELDAAEVAQASHRGRALGESGWLNRGAGPGAFNRSARQAAQLGVIEARIVLNATGTIARAMIAGDLIANSPGLAEFEGALCGRPLDLLSVSKAVTQVYGEGRNFILGIGDLANLARLVVSAQ
jgi:lipoate-protein ligase A